MFLLKEGEMVIQPDTAFQGERTSAWSLLLIFKVSIISMSVDSHLEKVDEKYIEFVVY